MDTIAIARRIVDLISDKKGEKIVLSDLRPVSVMADFFVIGEAPSDRQLNAIAEYIREEVKADFGIIPQQVEGHGEDGWVLIDYGSVVVHLFEPNMRNYYNLEELWQEAPVLVRMQ